MSIAIMPEMLTLEASKKHDRRCTCQTCHAEIERIFKPFNIVPWRTRIFNTTQSCPNCRRDIYGQGRGGYMVWSCWFCNMQEAKIFKIIDGGDANQFGFAAKATDGKSVYFHLSKRAEIIAIDGKPFPELFATTEIQIPTLETDILYQELVSEKGLKALWWAYKINYAQALESIKNRKTYRLMWRQGRIKLGKLDGAEPVYHQVWIGDNLSELQEHYQGTHYLYLEQYDAWYFEEAIFDAAGELSEWILCKNTDGSLFDPR